MATTGDYDYVIVNETGHPEEAAERIWEIIQAEARREPAARRFASELVRGASPARVRVAVDAVADRPERTFSYLLPAALGDAPSPARSCSSPTAHAWRSAT